MKMRSEQEMMDLILKTAQEDERVLAVYMNGSRTNPQAPRDIFQDYDIMYVVKETASFRADKNYIDRFGERLFMQYPEDTGDSPSDVENCYGWLIQFADGNRLDLHVCTVKYMQETIRQDRLCRILLDKEGILPQIPEASDEDFWIRRPSQKKFADTCNEFWWCLDNVAKGMWRREYSYVQDNLNFYIRPMLLRLLEWKAGAAFDFKVSGGKSGKYLHRFLPEELWESYLSTYSSCREEELWEAVFKMCRLFRRLEEELAENFAYPFAAEESDNCMAYLKHVRELPRDADEIYNS